jgi:hypothetical protein
MSNGEKYYVGEQLVAWRMERDQSLDVWAFPYVDMDTVPNQEHLIIQAEEEDRHTDQLRVEMFVSGYWWGVGLPYEHHPLGGLLVNDYLPLDWEITFARPWLPRTNGYDPSPWCDGVFCPSVPLTERPDWADKKFINESTDEDGFLADSWLIYPNEFYGIYPCDDYLP